jgi:hypothetical protein
VLDIPVEEHLCLYERLFLLWRITELQYKNVADKLTFEICIRARSGIHAQVIHPPTHTHTHTSLVL